MPALLADAGYNTYMTGKWHLGATEETSPSARGFQRTFILANAGAGALRQYAGRCCHLIPIIYRENGKQWSKRWQTTSIARATTTEKMIEFIDSDLDNGKPFFGLPGIHGTALATAGTAGVHRQSTKIPISRATT